jgi:hypothetical protein
MNKKGFLWELVVKLFPLILLNLFTLFIGISYDTTLSEKTNFYKVGSCLSIYLLEHELCYF